MFVIQRKGLFLTVYDMDKRHRLNQNLHLRRKVLL
jgi:hypothetical protein